MKLPFLLSVLLRPLGWIYALILAARRSAREAEFLPRAHAGMPVVSVGNIALGGTGKTPLVDWLLRWCADHALGVAVLSRGYGGSPPAMPYLVTPSADPAQSGDEPLLLARAHPEAHIVVDHKRARAARWARAHTDARLCLLDDGFQHVALARNVDIVLLRPEDLAEQWNAVLPSGPWREGKSALTRASVFGMKVAPQDFARLAPLIERRLGRYKKPVFSFSYAATGLRGVCAESAFRPNLDGAPYVLISGVGNPAHVRATASSLLGPPATHMVFADHHPFSASDLERLHERYPGLSVVCTVKDAVKLRRVALPQSDLWALDIRLNFGPCLGMESFPAWWEATVRGLV